MPRKSKTRQNQFEAPLAYGPDSIQAHLHTILGSAFATGAVQLGGPSVDYERIVSSRPCARTCRPRLVSTLANALIRAALTQPWKTPWRPMNHLVRFLVRNLQP